MMTETPQVSMRTILAPLSLQQFFDDYWEQSPLHIDGRPATYYESLVSIGDIQQLLSTQPLRFPDLQLANAHEPVTPDKYCNLENTVQTDRLWKLHHDGATLVLSQAHQLLPDLSTLCRQLLCEWKMPCQANLYLTPPDSQGFNIHYDSHDVFVLQVEGRKRFRFYKGGLSLPFSEQRFDPELDLAGEEQSSVELAPGDTLYIPRGMMHAAEAIGDESSLHITVGVYATTWRDLLLAGIECAAEFEQTLRSTVPLHYEDNLLLDGQAAVMRSLQLLVSCVSEEHLQKALSRIQDDVALSGIPVHGGVSSVVTESEDQATIDVNSVTINESAIVSIGSTPTGFSIRQPGRIVELEGPDAELWQQVLQQRMDPAYTSDRVITQEQNDRLHKLLNLGLITLIPAELT